MAGNGEIEVVKFNFLVNKLKKFRFQYFKF